MLILYLTFISVLGIGGKRHSINNVTVLSYAYRFMPKHGALSTIESHHIKN